MRCLTAGVGVVTLHGRAVLCRGGDGGRHLVPGLFIGPVHPVVGVEQEGRFIGSGVGPGGVETVVGAGSVGTASDLKASASVLEASPLEPKGLEATTKKRRVADQCGDSNVHGQIHVWLL